MASGRNLTVYLTSDVTKFGRGLKQAERGMDRFRRNAAKAVSIGAASLAAGAAAAIAVIGDSVQKASDLGEAISKTNQIFGESAKGIVAWADDADRAMGLSQRAALDVVATFGAIGKQAGMSQPEAAAFGKEMAQLAGDLASFNNTSVQDAATALASGLRGEAEPLRRYNINLAEAAVQAKALDAGLVKAVKDTTRVKQAQLTAMRAQTAYNNAVKEHGRNSDQASQASIAWQIAQEKLAKTMQGSVPKLTDAQKAQARTLIILEQGKDAIGDYERTADGLANTQRTATAQIEDIQADFGQGFIDGLGGIEDGAKDTKEALGDLEDDAKIFGAFVGGLARDLLGYAADFALGLQAIPTAFDDWINTLSGGVTNMRDWMGNIPFAGGNPLALTDEQAAAMRRAQDANAAANARRYNAIVNPPTSYDTASRLDTYSIATLYRYNPRAADANGRGDGRAAQKAARTRQRP